MAGGIGCGDPEASVVRRGLLADVAAHAPMTPRPAAVAERADLLEEIRAAYEHVRQQASEFGPELSQSGLLALLELRLPETYGHAQRVANASVALARAMGLRESDVRIIRRAAWLHDIGKLVVPMRLLRHRGRLEREEIAALQMHVTLGADLVAGISTLADTAPVIAATHERYDGSGYPNRLSGDDIPVGARIIAVADCYDAMVARRPYCEPISREDAHNEMVRCAGSHFDPAVVREWVVMIGTTVSPVPVSRPVRLQAPLGGRVLAGCFGVPSAVHAGGCRSVNR